MWIAVSGAGKVSLEDADNFRSFKIVCDPAVDSAGLGRAIDGLGTLVDDGAAAWLDPEQVVRLLSAPPGTEWRAAFDKMVATAARFGWVNPEGKVRAHVERTPT